VADNTKSCFTRTAQEQQPEQQQEQQTNNMGWLGMIDSMYNIVGSDYGPML